MKKSKYYVFLFIFLLLGSCKTAMVRGLAQNSLSNRVNFRSELGENRANGYGSFIEDSHSAIYFSIIRQYSFNNSFSTLALAYFLPNMWASYDTISRNYLAVGEVSIGSLNIPKDEQDAYPMFSPSDAESIQLANLLGTEVNFKITGNTSNGYPAFSHLMYIPKPLNVSFTHLQTYTSAGRAYITRNSNFKMKWVADGSNENGVLIRIYGNHKVDSVGNLQMNADLSSQTNIILAQDDGDYTFTPADFSGIPDGVELLITVIRGNVTIESIGEKTVKLYGREDVFAGNFLLMP